MQFHAGLFLFPLGMMLASLGCGHSDQLETALASGVVTLDGQPIEEGVVIFTPTHGRPARGLVDSHGRFTLSTFGEEDGAIVGSHQVAVIVHQGSENDFFERSPARGQASYRWLVPQRYANGATSGLEFEVQKDTNNEFAIELFTAPTEK